MSPEESLALDSFTDYMVRNYPGPNTIISDPKWHAPRIFRAALHALSAANAATLKAAQGGVIDASTKQRADAWDAVVAVLNDLCPAWCEPEMNGIACAVAAIRSLSAQQGQGDAVAGEGFDAWHDTRWPKPSTKHPHLQEAAEFHWRQQKATRREVWDAANAHATPALAGLRMALASQIEITNTERSRAEKLEAAAERVPEEVRKALEFYAGGSHIVELHIRNRKAGEPEGYAWWPAKRAELEAKGYSAFGEGTRGAETFVEGGETAQAALEALVASPAPSPARGDGGEG